jgi:hypothetical protein
MPALLEHDHLLRLGFFAVLCFGQAFGAGVEKSDRWLPWSARKRHARGTTPARLQNGFSTGV